MNPDTDGNQMCLDFLMCLSMKDLSAEYTKTERTKQFNRKGENKMAVNLKGRSFLTLMDFTPTEIRYLLDLAHNLKEHKRTGTVHQVLKGKTFVLIFVLCTTVQSRVYRLDL